MNAVCVCGRLVSDHFDSTHRFVACQQLRDRALELRLAKSQSAPGYPEVTDAAIERIRRRLCAALGDLVTRPRICEQLGISRWTWTRWVKCGLAPAPIAGLPGIPKWRRGDIDRFALGTFRFPGKRTYFTKTRHLHDEQAVQQAADRASQSSRQSRKFALGGGR